MDFETAKQIIRENSNNRFTITYPTDWNKEPEKVRIFISANDHICKYAPRAKRYGYPLSLSHIISIVPIGRKKTEEQQWIEGWTKVLNRLKSSGLWENIQEEIKIALEIGYTGLKRAYEIETKSWGLSYSKEPEEQEQYKKIIDSLIAIDSRLVSAGTREDNKDQFYPNTSIIWSYAKLPVVKKMRFVKWNGLNEIKLKEIAVCMENKKDCYQSGRTSYDVSFEYKAESNKAWYSEEYKNCGNGHYYIALDSTHALFYEDD